LDFTTSDDQFWDFSWEDMGNYDLPAMLNYVLQTSGRPTLSYIGHSEGTTQAFVGFSMNQSLARKVSYFGALGPVAFVSRATSLPFQFLAHTRMDSLASSLGLGEFGSRSYLFSDLISTYGCAIPQAHAPCDSIIQSVVGSAPHNFNTSRIHVYISQTPAGTSVKTMTHYAQNIRAHTFRRFDYGCECSRDLPLSLCSSRICKNKAVYGTMEPPPYDLNKMRYPRTSLYQGEQDSLAVPADVAKLRAQLPNSTIIRETMIPDFNHLDYSWAITAKDKLYDALLAEMKLYEGKGY
jgi:pimeloyl-ACP methyl ester carboxylesterase